MSPLLSENPVLSQHLPTATLAYRRQPTTELLNNAGDSSSAHSLSLWIRTVYPKNSQIMIFWPYAAYPTSLSLLISSPTVCHHSSGIFALLNVGHCFFQASKGQPNTITWDLWQAIKPCHRFSLLFSTLYSVSLHRTQSHICSSESSCGPVLQLL